MDVTGQKSEVGLRGSEIWRMPSLCCNVLDQRIQRTAPLRENLMPLPVRCLDGSEARAEGTLRLDFLRKENRENVMG